MWNLKWIWRCRESPWDIPRLQYNRYFLIKFNFLLIKKKSLIPDATTAKRKLHEAVLNAGQEDEMIVYGYRRSKLKTALCYLFIVLTVGLLRLVMHWWSHWLLLSTHTACSLDEAEKVLVVEKFEGKHTIHYVKSVVNLDAETIKWVFL